MLWKGLMVDLGFFMLYCLVSFDAFCLEGESTMFTIYCVACYFYCSLFCSWSLFGFCHLTFWLNEFPLGILLWLLRSVLGWYICSCIHLSSFKVLIGGNCSGICWCLFFLLWIGSHGCCVETFSFLAPML